MRAVVVREFGGIENASLGDMPKPAPKAGEVLLEVRADNDAAARLYALFGFDRIGVRRGYYQPGRVDAVVMRLRPGHLGSSE